MTQDNPSIEARRAEELAREARSVRGHNERERQRVLAELLASPTARRQQELEAELDRARESVCGADLRVLHHTDDGALLLAGGPIDNWRDHPWDAAEHLCGALHVEWDLGVDEIGAALRDIEFILVRTRDGWELLDGGIDDELERATGSSQLEPCDHLLEALEATLGELERFAERTLADIDELAAQQG